MAPNDEAGHTPPRRSTRTKVVLLGVGIAAVALAGLVAIGVALTPSIPRNGSAKYRGFSFARHPHFRSVSARCSNDRAPELYLQFPDGSRYRIDELPEERAVELCTSAESSSPVTVERNKEIATYLGNGSLLKFRDGKLYFAGIDYQANVLIGPTREGPFVSLPINYDELVQVFGEPHDWTPFKYQGL